MHLDHLLELEVEESVAQCSVLVVNSNFVFANPNETATVFAILRACEVERFNHTILLLLVLLIFIVANLVQLHLMTLIFHASSKIIIVVLAHAVWVVFASVLLFNYQFNGSILLIMLRLLLYQGE